VSKIVYKSGNPREYSTHTQWRIYAKWRPWQSLNVHPFQ